MNNNDDNDDNNNSCWSESIGYSGTPPQFCFGNRRHHAATAEAA
jgi:hypothetical protein